MADEASTAGGEPDEDVSAKKFSRSYVACRRCHSHKVKCSGETPCRNCKNARHPTECVYPVRDRKVAVTESYLKKLEEENNALKRKRSPEPTQYATPFETSPSNGFSDTPHPIGNSVLIVNQQQQQQQHDPNALSDETPIQPSFTGEAACTTFGNRLQHFLQSDDRHPSPRPYVFYKNPKLLRIASTDCQLPNRNYGRLLVRAVIRFIGGDYHLLMRKSFLERLDETYKLDTLDDPVWLCRLFTVFALGELYSTRPTSSKHGPGVPGTGFFLQAMGLFQDMHEEPSVSYIETLLLLSFYCLSLNRRNTAYTYAGLALRLSLTLGLHRKIRDDSPLKPVEREHRIRVWWTVYTLDRIYSTKVGLPVMLRDEDIDVQMPSLDGLSDTEREDFYGPELMTAQIRLAQISGNVLSEVYRIAQPGRANHFVQSVHRILTSLRSWHEALPTVLKLDFGSIPIYSSRSVASLHLHFGNAVILTTRPILFHLFRSRFRHAASEAPARQLSPMTTALAEACVHAARTSNEILAQLWVDGCLASFGFLDALSVFSSTLILMMSSTLKAEDENADVDAVETAWSLLKFMRDSGNLAAVGYYDQLVELKSELDLWKQKVRRAQPEGVVSGATGFHMLLAASDTVGGSTARMGGATSNPLPVEGMAFGLTDVSGAGVLLDDPFLQDFLQQPYGSWEPGFEQMPAGDSNSAAQWSLFDWQDANLFGNV